MVLTPSTMVGLGTEAPDFSLPDADGNRVALADFASAQGLLMIFLCNHCPFVKHVREELIRFANDYRERGLAIVGINPNDVERYPDDSPEKMKQEGYPFPYLVDESQQVATAYRAACTPDFFLYDADRRLVYRGQLDASRPGNDRPVDGRDLRAAADRLLAGRPALEEQRPSAGCNIKWKPGQEPDYFGG